MQYFRAMMRVKFLPTLPSLLTSRQTPFIHRDLSWLQFNERVLDEARQSSNPLLERVKFLAITSSNLDEFFMIRASSIERAVSSKNKKLELRQARRLGEIRYAILESVAKFISKQVETLELLSNSLSEFGVRIVRTAEPGSEEFELGKQIFERDILPRLHPPESFSFAHLNALENLQAAVIFPGQLWLRIPRSLPGMFAAKPPQNGKKSLYFYFLDDLLAAHLWPSAGQHWSPGFIRLTRDGDFTLDFGDKDPESLPDVVMSRLGGRERGRPLRLQYSGSLTPEFLSDSRAALKLLPEQILPASGSLYLHGLWTLVNKAQPELSDISELTYPPLQSKIPPTFHDPKKIFEKLSHQDCLLHHPYDSFDSYVAWIKAACEDPLVESIQQTVYRMDALSPVSSLLKEVAKTKKVRIVIELRARFDELNNLRLADELQKAGVDVAFGFGSLKVHAKVALVSRRENGELKLYSHLSTGNYNANTARQYTDLAILTANPEIGADAQHFFDQLFQGTIPGNFKQLVTAPNKLARRLVSLIQAEAEAAKQGKKARIFAKVNALVDPQIIEHLYEASRSGVRVDLVVRGACALIPGVKGLSENIRVVSIVDRFLEHSRIYYFENSKKMYLSSADWMPRNFFSRLEIAFPVLDPTIYEYLEQIVIPAYLSDTVKARELTHQGTWKKRTPKADGPNIRSQVLFRELALHDYKGTPLEGR